MLGGKEPTACRRLRLLTVLLGIFIASANGIETEVIPRNPSEGHPVLINIIGITEDIRFSEWYLGNNTSAENQIIRYNNGDGSQNKGAKYFTGANIYPNGSLEIQNFQKKFESNYTVFIQGTANPYQQTETQDQCLLCSQNDNHVGMRTIILAPEHCLWTILGSVICRHFTVLLSIFIASANEIETEVIPRNPSEGHPVIINIIGITEDIRFSEWYRGNNIFVENQIIRYNNGDGSQNKGAKYFTGANIYPNGSLEFQNFQREFESNYTIFIQGMSKPYQQTVFLSVAMVSANTIQVQRIPDTPQVNQNVLFDVTGISETIRFSEWYRGNDTSAANQIIRYNNNDNSKNVGARHINSSTIFANGSLEIKNVTKDLEGDYTVFIQGAQNPFQKTVSLKVVDPNLSVGAIIGIVIGVLVAVTLAIVLGVYVFKSKDSGPL